MFFQENAYFTLVTHQWRRPLRSYGAVPRGPLPPSLKVLAACLEVLWRRPSRSRVRRASRPIGTKFFQFIWFLTPPTKMSYTTPINIQNMRFYEMIIWKTVPSNWRKNIPLPHFLEHLYSGPWVKQRETREDIKLPQPSALRSKPNYLQLLYHNEWDTIRKA